ncbi:MAG: hypothetical protein AAF993_16210, partial [Pseudomonadota bacterium]
MSNIFAFGLGIASHNNRGEVLDCLFPNPLLRPDAELAKLCDQFNGATIKPDDVSRLDPDQQLAPAALLEHDQPLVCVRLTEDRAITSTAEAY